MAVNLPTLYSAAVGNNNNNKDKQVYSGEAKLLEQVLQLGSREIHCLVGEIVHNRLAKFNFLVTLKLEKSVRLSIYL